jgi:hypothetical protein
MPEKNNTDWGLLALGSAGILVMGIIFYFFFVSGHI